MGLQDEVNTVTSDLLAERAKSAEVTSYLQKAEEYIMQLQREKAPVSEGAQGGNADLNRVIQLEQALEQQHRNQKSQRDQY